MSGLRPLGPLVHSFFIDHLVAVKGLRPATVRSYRDTVRLLLLFVAKNKKAKITKLGVEDLSFERVLGFLRVTVQPQDGVESANGRVLTRRGRIRDASERASRSRNGSNRAFLWLPTR